MNYQKSQKQFIKSTYLVIVLIIINQFVIQYWLYKKRSDSHIINLAGRQRMLSQKINMHFYRLVATKQKNAELIEDFKLWEKIHKAFLFGNSDLSVSKIETNNVRRILLRLNHNIEIARKYAVSNGIPTDSEISVITNNQSDFLKQMDIAVKKLEIDSDFKLRVIIFLEILFTVLSIIAVYAKIKFQFLPIILSSCNQRHELQKKNIEINQTKQKLLSILNSTKEMMFLTDRELNLVSVNKRATDVLENLFKKPPEIGQNIFSVIPTQIKKTMFDGLTSALNEKDYEIEFMFEINAKKRYFLANFYPAFSDSSRLIGVILTITDITKTKEIEHKVHERALMYENLFENNKAFVIKMDSEGNYTFANQYFLNSMYPKNYNFLDRKLLDIVVNDDKKNLITTLNNCVKKPNKSFFITLRIPMVSGNFRYSSWEFKLENIAGNKDNHILGIGFDVTELSLLLAETQNLLDITNAQNNKLQKFSYIISHNIKSHSANLVALIDYLDSLDLESEKSNIVNMLKSTIGKLDETINNLNEVLAINQSINKPKESIDLKSKTVEILSVLSDSIEKKQIEIINEVLVTTPVSFIPEYLDSVLMNVISNAINYSSEGELRFIKMTVDKIPNYTVFSISDNGIGIDLEKNQEKIFGMYKTFHQNENTRGLGLFLSKNHMELMGGKIEVESKLGVGTIFKLYFYEKN